MSRTSPASRSDEFTSSYACTFMPWSARDDVHAFVRCAASDEQGHALKITYKPRGRFERGVEAKRRADGRRRRRGLDEMSCPPEVLPRRSIRLPRAAFRYRPGGGGWRWPARFLSLQPRLFQLQFFSMSGVPRVFGATQPRAECRAHTRPRADQAYPVAGLLLFADNTPSIRNQRNLPPPRLEPSNWASTSCGVHKQGGRVARSRASDGGSRAHHAAAISAIS